MSTKECLDVRLIHPLDALEIFEKFKVIDLRQGEGRKPAPAVCLSRMYRGADGWHKEGESFELDGVVYVQTALAPAKTTRYS